MAIPTKRELQRRYAQQRREALEQYREQQGSGRGWTTSDEYKRIQRNQRAAERRYQRRIEREAREREIRSATREEIEQQQTVISQVQEWDSYFNVAGYTDGPRSVIREVFQGIRGDKSKPTYLRIVYPEGREVIARTQTEADRALQQFFKHGNALARKTGDNYALQVATVDGMTDTENFVNVYGFDASQEAGDFEFPDLPSAE